MSGSRRRGAAVTAVFALAGVGIALGAALAHLLLFAPAGTGSGTADVRIDAGSTLRQIARTLADAGVVDRPHAFVLLARLGGLDRRLHPGDYRFDPGASLPEVLRALAEGRGRTTSVTIPEGWRLEQIADRLAASGICDSASFLSAARNPELLSELEIPGPSAEGFLYPETYTLPMPAEPAAVIRSMRRQFGRVWDELTAGDRPPPLLETVTLASIVERETAVPEERPLVAAVFLNRLRLGMPLQADPTVMYGLEGFDGTIRRRDLSSPHPYNTYVIRGLPPGPIANPGRTSLAAVLAPADVDYLYFVSRNDGTHQFSRSLREHNEAVQRFRAQGRRPG